MAALLVDTRGWLELRDKGDARHREALSAFEEQLRAGRPLPREVALSFWEEHEQQKECG